MIYAYTSLFHRSYNGLSGKQQAQIDEAIRRLCGNPHPPFPKGWRVHKLHGVIGTAEKDGDTPPDVWEMHCPGKGALIVTFQRSDEGILFRNCGLHDKTLLNP